VSKIVSSWKMIIPNPSNEEGDDIITNITLMSSKTMKMPTKQLRRLRQIGLKAQVGVEGSKLLSWW
jgi:hypothetical protein